MASDKLVKKFLSHPDKDEVISKLVLGTSPEEIHIWLQDKYTAEAENRFVLSIDFLRTFKDKHLDFYLTIRDDILATKASGGGTAIDKALSVSVKKNKKYRERITELAGQEVDIKQRVIGLLNIIETRVEQVFDKIQTDPDTFEDDHTLIKYLKLLMEASDQVFKIVNNGPDQIVHHQHTIQVADQQISFILDGVREIIEEFDPERAFLFMERYNERIGKLQAPEENKIVPTEVRLAEAKFVTETLAEKAKL